MLLDSITASSQTQTTWSKVWRPDSYLSSGTRSFSNDSMVHEIFCLQWRSL